MDHTAFDGRVSHPRLSCSRVDCRPATADPEVRAARDGAGDAPPGRRGVHAVLVRLGRRARAGRRLGVTSVGRRARAAWRVASQMRVVGG